MTRALQSSPFQKFENLKKSQKIPFFNKKNVREKKIAEKNCYSLSFPVLGGRDSTRALQSSPFQNPGGSPEPDGRTDGQRKSSCLIKDVNVCRDPENFSILDS